MSNVVNEETEAQRDKATWPQTPQTHSDGGAATPLA